MILRKPYVLFIKLFKPAHIFMSVLIAFLIYNTNKILNFLSNYIYSDVNVVGQQFKSNLVNTSLFIIPIILIIFSLIFLGVMFSKEKKIVFYLINIFCSIAVLIINIYCANFLGIMEKNVISIKLVKLNHDLIFINLVIEVILFIVLVIRGLGFNFKKLDFNSDISKFDISERDKEEIEVNINLDFDDQKRERRKKLRHLKYLYYENKTIINIVLITFIVLVGTITTIIIVNKEKTNVEGMIYNIGKFNLRVDETFLLTDSYKGKNISENYFLVTRISLQSNLKSVSLFLEDFNLKIGSSKFKPNNKFAKEFIDIGNIYEESILQSKYNNFILIFEIPEKYIESEMFLGYNNAGYETIIKLNPKIHVSKEFSVSNKINEILNFKDSFEGLTFSIKNFDIKKTYQVNYNYCIKDNDCLKSIEYLTPTLNENFDKVLLMLEYDFSNNTKINNMKFYDFFEKFGSIHYKKGEKWYSQSFGFEQVKSKKTKQKNKVYIGVNAGIVGSDSIKLVYKIRNSNYEYILK